MTSEPKAPGAPAVYLYREVVRDDASRLTRVSYYFRLKVLTEEGQKYANIEIPFNKRYEAVEDIKARVIHPDGSVLEFHGIVSEKELVKPVGAKSHAKNLAVPDVRIGSIVEYRYAIRLVVAPSSRQVTAPDPGGNFFPTDVYEETGLRPHWNWVLNAEMFTKRAKFTLKKYPVLELRWSWPAGLPPGTQPPKQVGDCTPSGGVPSSCLIQIETHDIPALTQEKKYYVHFAYYDPVSHVPWN